MPPDKKVEKMKQLLSVLNEGITRGDFEELSSQILTIVKQIKAKNEEEKARMSEIVQSTLSQVSERLNADLSDFRASIEKKLEEQINSMQLAHESMLSEVDAKVKEIKNGEDGKDGEDADEDAIVERVLGSIKIPEPPKESDIIKKVVASIPKQEKTWIGGGASVIHKFIDDETPTGTKNGVNTVFTLTKAPVNGSLKLYRGGARQRVTEDFTLSGRTITFTVAPASGEILLADYRHF